MPHPSDERNRNNLSPSHVGHVIVCGLGQEPQEDDEVFPKVMTIEGDPSSEAVLRKALIEKAYALISTAVVCPEFEAGRVLARAVPDAIGEDRSDVEGR